jgi:exodeoxyribonuclease V alpha subunit
LSSSRKLDGLFDRSEDSSINGVVKKVVYASEASGWAVLRVQLASRRTMATVVGPLVGVQPGETVGVTGQWVKDPKYGRQFRAQTYLSLQPQTLEGLESYLGSGLVPGIGKVMAQRMVEQFGLDTLTVLDESPERLVEVQGIGRQRAAKIRAAWKRQTDARDVMVFLRTYGITPSQSLKIYKRYGKDTVELLKANPYRLAAELYGIGFQTADRIAERMGVSRDSPDRARAGITHVLAQAEQDGHVFLPRRKLLDLTKQLLDQPTSVVLHALESSLHARELFEDRVVVEGETGAIYRPSMYGAETEIASRLKDLDQAGILIEEAELHKRLQRLRSLRDIRLSSEQSLAIQKSMTDRLLIITGGPGTGKTTLIRAIVEDQRKEDKRVLLAAPTGRAAKRLAAASRADARTLHRLLEFEPRSMTFQRHRDRPLEADSIIVDESSMLDTLLAHHLLQAVPDGCQLILVGDVDQLPPVGPGKVLADLISSGSVSVVRLKEIFRQEESGLIVENAHRIRRGQPLHLERDLPADFYFIDRRDPEDLLATLDHLISTRIPRRFGFDPKTDLQVLTPMRRGLVGSENLNLRVQDLVNKDSAGIELIGGRLRRGDRVMQVRNNYDLDVFNGDIGTVVGPTSDGESVRIKFDDRSVEYSASELEEVVLAYACSVHKAQGSEFPCVILILHNQHYVMLQRNLLYTGVTRGQKLVIVLGEPRSVSLAISNDRPTMRYTRLSERLGNPS